MKTEPPKTFRLRLGLVALGIGALALTIAAKLILTVVSEGPELREQAEKLVLREVVVPADRGNIYSSDGKLLATTMPVYDLFMDPMAPTEEAIGENLRALSNKLARKFPNRSASEWERFIRYKREKGDRYIRIGENVSFTELQEIRQYPLFNLGKYKGGLIAEQENYRKMPLGKVAERTIGYDGEFQAGLEGAFSSYLSGQNGKRLKQRISKGFWKPVAAGLEEEPRHGYDLITTLDTRMQDVAHRELKKALEHFEADHGCVVVMEVATGQVKAIANLGRTEEGEYLEQRNYAVWETTEPGSTFKLASLMIALDDGMIDTADIVNTGNGVYPIYNRKVKDSNVKNGRGGYGEINVAEAFRKSSNVGIVKAIYPHYKDDPERFVDQLYNLGLHKPLDLSIKGEGNPRIPKPSDPNWSGTSLPWMTFGYEVSLTPIQVLSIYNAVANDGVMVKPLFVKEIRDGGRMIESFEPEVINPAICSKSTIAQLQYLLEGVVNRGTAQSIYNPQMPMAGKTGTCQLNYWKGSLDYQASFAGYFPANDPKYSCIVVINKPNPLKGFYGSTVAAPVFKAVADEIFLRIPEELKQENPNRILATAEGLAPDQDQGTRTMPDLAGISGNEALAFLENHGIQAKITGNGVVVGQWPKPGTSLQNIRTVTLFLE
ncbi:MAG: transpeptidase family protein [Bacteroidota bacterium]|nr:transpeptidase family protein [Bacteroidota bacterium]